MNEEERRETAGKLRDKIRKKFGKRRESTDDSVDLQRGERGFLIAPHVLTVTRCI